MLCDRLAKQSLCFAYFARQRLAWLLTLKNLPHAMQGESPPLEDILKLRNAVAEAEDLRRPVNLQDQVSGSCCSRCSLILAHSVHTSVYS